MKRCPQCEFLYEDDQSLCDMDGILLVYDSRQLPHLQGLSTTTTQITAKAGSRKNKVPALASVVLATVLALVYYVSTQRHTSQATYTPTTTSSSTTVGPDPNVTPSENKVVDGSSNESNGVKPEESAKDSEANSKSNSDKPATDDSSARKKSTTKPKVAPMRAEQSPPEKDSKVESFFKKTGRILKKPFKH